MLDANSIASDVIPIKSSRNFEFEVDLNQVEWTSNIIIIHFELEKSCKPILNSNFTVSDEMVMDIGTLKYLLQIENN